MQHSRNAIARSLGRGHWLAGIAIVSLVPALLAQDTVSRTGERLPASAVQPSPSAPTVAGRVRSDAGAVGGAMLTLRLLGPTGEEVWSTSRLSAPDGAFRIDPTDIPASALAASNYPGRLVVSARGFGGDSAMVMLVRQNGALTSIPARFDFVLLIRNASLLIYLLIPAGLGLFLALINLVTPEFGTSKRLLIYRHLHPAIYAFAVAAVWTAAIGFLVYAFVVHGQEFIPLGLGELAVPSLLVIGAYIGSLTYVAYSVHVRGSEFFAEEKTEARRDLLRVLGGRLLVAPYVAVIGYAVLSPAFPGLSSSPSALFFGFFTGIWIKPVLEALNGVGKRLLSEESQAKAAARLESSKGTDRNATTGTLTVRAGEEYRYNNGKAEVSLKVDRSRIAIRLAAGKADPKEVGATFRLTLVRPEPWEQYYVFATGGAVPEQYNALATGLEADARVARVRPVFGDGGADYAFAGDRVLFSLVTASATLPTTVDEVLTWHRAVVRETADGEYHVEIDARGDPLALASALAALEVVDYAEPDLIHVNGALGSYAPNCPDDEGALAFTLTKVREAWSATAELPLDAIRIAILDDGADLSHPDLALTQAEQFDAFRGELAQCPLPHDRHGTNCAGVAVARPEKKGMKGVGFGCSLFVARINYRPVPGGDIVTSSRRLRMGIDAAVKAGADVLSLSWSAEPSVTVQLAIERAVKQGRDGRGCVVVAAAGNDGGRVRFPAQLDQVIAVAGTDGEGRLMRTPTWSSNFGPEVDVAAPAMGTFTTDPADQYTCAFQGTSAATALVAGAAGLLLRANGSLSAKEVKDLLMSTASVTKQQVGGRTVTLKVVDVEAAVLKALP